jgi:RNA polymerase sigma factor (sigma-70 family)
MRLPSPPVSDDDLVAACLRGETDAWSEVLERYGRLVRSIPRAYGLGREDVDEVTQLTFTILVQSLPRLRADTRLAPWLSTVARRHTWRLLEARRREVATDVADVVPPHDDVRRDADLRADAEWLRAGLQRLSSRCRQLLEALYLHGEVGYVDVAADLGMPIGSIGPTRARCLQHLRTLLDASARDGQVHEPPRRSG